QWRKELEDPQRLSVGRWNQERSELLSLASGWLVAGELQVMLVAVQPAQQRQGLGRQVLQALLEQAQQLGCHLATLEVAASNPAAIAL
ncbi:MAG: GNAT family N-acetyltransferase, partial [Synechococcus sp.]